MYFLHVNLLAVLTAAVIQFMLGWLWYGVIFAKPWRALVGVKEGEKSDNAGGVMALIFVANLILSFAIAQIMLLTPWANFSKGTLEGVICGLGFVVPPLIAQHVAERKPFKLFAINALYWLFAMMLSGGLLACWH
jgi:Protein of unknown function (DUF1761)